MFGSDSLDRFGLPTMPEGWDQPPPQPLQWQGVAANPFFGGPGGNVSMAPPAAPGMVGGDRGAANPSVPALMSGNPLAQGAAGSALSRTSAPDVAPAVAAAGNPAGSLAPAPAAGPFSGVGVRGSLSTGALSAGAGAGSLGV